MTRTNTDTSAAAEAVVADDANSLFPLAVFALDHFQRRDSACLLAKAAAEAGFNIDSQGVIGLRYSHGISPLHPAEQFTAAGTAVADK